MIKETAIGLKRCAWVPGNDQMYIKYHDEEWGVPVHDEAKLFEFLILEGAQAGLSWKTILMKRDNFRLAFDHFDPAKVALYSDKKLIELQSNPGIIRNRLKILSAVANANAFLEAQREYGNFDSYIWGFVGGTPIKNNWEDVEQVPSRSPQSDSMSRDLLKRGFKFVGSTICYSFMQATGMVNDHTTDCFRHNEV